MRIWVENEQKEFLNLEMCLINGFKMRTRPNACKYSYTDHC